MCFITFLIKWIYMTHPRQLANNNGNGNLRYYQVEKAL